MPNVNVPVGGAVTWTNQDGVPHTTTSGKDGKFDGVGWDSPSLSTGLSFSHTFTQAGTFSYTCRIHPSLKGAVTVGAGGTPEAQTGTSTEKEKKGEGGDYSY